jgi:hypothetical protein
MQTRNLPRSDPSTSQAPQSTAKPKRKAPGGRSQNKPSGKKGPTSSVFSNKSGTPDLEITEEDMAMYRAIQAKLKGEKRTAVTAQNEGKLFLNYYNLF